MRLAAIYIEEHEFLFNNQPQILNFGSEYVYKFSKKSKNIIVSRERNNQYVEGLFNVSNSTVKINLITAIVGENGTGKSSVLDCIRSLFIEHKYALPSGDITVLVEDGNELKVLYSNYSVALIYGGAVKKYLPLKDIEKIDFQSIYFSPHLDLKYNFNFDNFDSYDISIDKTIEKDLEDLDKKGTNESGWKYHPTQELVFKNSLRQIGFLNSDIARSNKVFNEIFSIPKFEKGIIIFRDYNIDPELWNIPRQFKYVFKLILEKLESENNEWAKIRKFNKENNVINQIAVNRYLLERFIIKCFLSVIIEQMDKVNTFLEEGVLPDAYDLKKYTDFTAIEVFKDFIKKSFVEKGKHKFKVFNHIEIDKLFICIAQILDKAKDEREISKTSIHVNLSDIEELLYLHKKTITSLFNYFPKYEGDVIGENYYVDGFISFRPTDRNLSSGENALLNFFSKLHNFVEYNLAEDSKFLQDKKHYILLLDEADLGFHPTWKKKYIKSLIYSLPHFFENLKLIPSLQIIFTTHDPFTLSDLPNNSIIYIKKDNENSRILNIEDIERPTKTFGANISNLLSDSFFINDGLIGDFAKERITETIDWINKNKNSKDRNVQKFPEEIIYYKKIISLIDEHITKIKLSEMISELEPDNQFQKQILDDEIDYLLRKRQNL
jgi:ABC-type dipeptide/oligopeptide/nickel transport system ATPase component